MQIIPMLPTMKKLEIQSINLKGLELIITYDVINYYSYSMSHTVFLARIFGQYDVETHDISNKSIIEHQKDSLRKVKREMCLTDEKLNILTEGNIITWFITLFIMWSTVNVKTINYMKTINVD